MAKASANNLLQDFSFQGLVAHIKKLVLNQSNILSVVIVIAIGMLLVPLPAFILDLAFVLNFAVSTGIILVTLYTKEPLEFTTFPTVLLLVTLGRLAIEISATRSILLHAHAGNVIHSIGEFVVGGNFVVGIIIFIILFIINFIVVTQGAGRVSEVAARFSLDSMPGKQLAVDADLNAGIIDEASARERRKQIAREADFYATMDGGSKFVKGDAIASIIIAFINVIAGFVIGVMQLQLSAIESASTYTLLTIGEGLASQIPALIISIATGIIVTRSNPDLNLAEDIGVQLFGRKEVIAVSALAMILFALTVRGAFIPFFAVGAALAWWAYRKYKLEQVEESGLLLGPDDKVISPEEQKELESKERIKQKEQDNTPEGVIKLLKVDQIEVEIGYKLINLIDPKKDGDLMSRIGQIRRQVMIDLGLPVPAIRVHDNLQVAPNEYQVKLRGAVIAKGSVVPDCYLAVNTGLVDADAALLDGIVTQEPSYGLPAVWVRDAEKSKAETLGYTIATASSVLATHLTEIIRMHAGEILSRQDLVRMLDQVKEHNESIVSETNSFLSTGELLAVLQCLLREQVSIRDLSSVLEHIISFAKVNKDPEFLGERVREAMGRQICSQFLVEGTLNCMTFYPSIEEELIHSLHLDRLALEPSRTKEILEKVSAGFEKLSDQGLPPVLLCNNKIRLPLRKLTERNLPQLNIIAYSEVPSNMDAQSVLMLKDEATAS
jgi:flagellar biosynthesis protein FlhA